MSTRDEQKKWLEETEWVTWDGGGVDAMNVAFEDGQPKVAPTVYDLWAAFGALTWQDNLTGLGDLAGAPYAEAHDPATPHSYQEERDPPPRAQLADPAAFQGGHAIVILGGDGEYRVTDWSMTWVPGTPAPPGEAVRFGDLRAVAEVHGVLVDAVALEAAYRRVWQATAEAFAAQMTRAGQVFTTLAEGLNEWVAWWQRNAPPAPKPKAKRKPQRMCPRHGEVASRCRACWRHR